MKYTPEEVMEYIEEEDVKFIRLTFFDIYGKQKNISIMPSELRRAFKYGISFDASAISGFSDVAQSDLFLHPDASTLAILPWRPEHGRVVRMYCSISHPDGSPYECDCRKLLSDAVKAADEAGLSFYFGSEQEFYLFELNENGEKTYIPYDHATYMDIAPDDKGENIRREICLTLEQMGISPESSHHEEGPGQNEIDFRYSDAMTAADDAMTFQTVVKSIAARNGLWASFSPRPLEKEAGNGYHINISAKIRKNENGEATHLPCAGITQEQLSSYIIAGLLNRVSEMTAFLNPCDESYKRLGKDKAPSYISWSPENRSQLIRVPAAYGEYSRIELRSPDSASNPYIDFALIIYAALEGIQSKSGAPDAVNRNLYTAEPETLDHLEKLPATRQVAQDKMRKSEFIKNHIPHSIIKLYSSK